MSSIEAINEIKARFESDIRVARKSDDSSAFQNLKSKYLGKKGEISGLMRLMGSLLQEERPIFGKEVNILRDYAEDAFSSWSQELEETEIAKNLNASGTDPTLPGIKIPLGTIHPMNQVRDDIIDFFHNLGFQMATGPEVDTDWYNFEALNLPPDHPARDMHDTFYVDDKVVLRTHTSNIQIHVMETTKPPFRLIAPGFVYRVDNDATHSPMFQQVEGLVVDENVSFAHLKGILYLWAKHMFGQDVTMRFRPSFFPFTEPSAEMDISCYFCKQSGCRICKQTGWIEIGGCGSVDPNVFENVGVDPEKFMGFAFGFGIDRITMLKYSIPDIGLLTRNDNRFLKQF